MTEIDRLIAMLEPNAEENTVLFVREQLGKMLHGAYTNDYVPRLKLDDEVFPKIEDDWSTTSQGERSDQQSIDPFDNGEYHPNDPRNW